MAAGARLRANQWDTGVGNLSGNPASDERRLAGYAVRTRMMTASRRRMHIRSPIPFIEI